MPRDVCTRASSRTGSRATRRRRGPKIFCDSSFATSSAATIRQTGKFTRRFVHLCRTPPSAPSREASNVCAVRASRPRSSPSIRRPATSSRWSAAPTTCAARSTAPCAAGGNRDRRSSPSSTRRRSRRDTRRCRCCRICRKSRRRRIPNGIRATRTASSSIR